MPRKKREAKTADLETPHLPADAENPSAGDLGPVRHPVIHPKAIEYVRLRNARMAAGREEKEAHTDLLNTMLEEGVQVYQYGGVTVNVQNNPKVKATVAGTDPETEEAA